MWSNPACGDPALASGRGDAGPGGSGAGREAAADAGETDRAFAVIRQYVSLPISAGLSRADAEVLYDLLPASVKLARSGGA